MRHGRLNRGHSASLLTCVVAAAVLMSSCGGSGGGGDGGDEILPLWVPTDVAVVDLNGDGRNDVLTLKHVILSETRREGRLQVWLQTGAGTFAPPETYVVGIYPWRFALGDVNSDGALDIVVADPDADAAWVLLQASGRTGRFDSPRQVVDQVSTDEAYVADLNGDDAADIVIDDSARASNRLVVLLQNSSMPGSFAPPMDIPMSGTTGGVTAADVDANGFADLLSWEYTTGGDHTPQGELAVIWQRGGELGSVTALPRQTGVNVRRLAILDYDGDGRQDLFAYFTPWSADYRAMLTVVLQTGTVGSFAAPVTTSLGDIRGIDDAVFADLNDDGRPDAAVAGFFPVGSPSRVESRVNLFIQVGGGAFAPSAMIEAPSGTSRITAGDVDADGRTDLVILAGEEQGVRCLVLVQSHGAPGEFAAPRPLG